MKIGNEEVDVYYFTAVLTTDIYHTQGEELTEDEIKAYIVENIEDLVMDMDLSDIHKEQ